MPGRSLPANVNCCFELVYTVTLAMSSCRNVERLLNYQWTGDQMPSRVSLHGIDWNAVAGVVFV